MLERFFPLRWLLTWGVFAGCLGTALFFLGSWVAGLGLGAGLQTYAKPLPLATDRAGGRLMYQLDWLHRVENRATFGDTQDALATLDGIKLNPVEQEAAVRGYFYRLAADPKAALEQAAKIKNADYQLVALTTLLGAWMPAQASQTVAVTESVHTHGPVVGLGLLLLQGDHPQTDLAMQWYEVLQPQAGQGYFLGKVAGVLLKTDPKKAVALGRGLKGNEYVRFVHWLGWHWVQQDPAAAIQWAAEIPDAVSRECCLHEITQTWASNDLETAKKQIDSVPDGPARIALTHAVAGLLAGHDTARAFEWLGQIADPALRALADTAVRSVAPEGIGMGLTADHPPLVVHLLTGSPAVTSGEIELGDAVVGVDTDNSGRFTDTILMEHDEVYKLVRGAAGTKVGLSVAKRCAGGFQPPHVVCLTRAQLIYHPDSEED